MKGKGMTKAERKELARLAVAVGRTLREDRERIDALERRIDALEVGQS